MKKENITIINIVDNIRRLINENNKN